MPRSLYRYFSENSKLPPRQACKECLFKQRPWVNQLSNLYERLRVARVTRSGISRRFPVTDQWHRAPWFRRWRPPRTVIFRHSSSALKVSSGHPLSCDQTRPFSPVTEGRTLVWLITSFNHFQKAHTHTHNVEESFLMFTEQNKYKKYYST